MSLDFLEEKIDGIRTEAERLREGYAHVQAEVAADPNLTDVGKLDQLAPLHQQLGEQLKALRQQEKDVVKTKRESLERAVFGSPAGATVDPARIVVHRDARDRASQLEHREDAEEAYRSALQYGDDVLAQAILAKALSRGWSNITDDYLDRHPQSRADLKDLKDLAQYEQNSMGALVHYMMPALTTDRPFRLS